jgi:hypothetical protein
VLGRVQRPWPSYLRRDLKPLTQVKYPRAAEWLKLGRGGYLTYILRHIHPTRPPSIPRQGHPSEEAAWIKWEGANNRFLALHWMCTYIDALCVPTMDAAQQERIQYLAKKASWYWYKYLPSSMHTLLTHAMFHLAEQAVEYGPQCLYWLFHKERSSCTHSLQSPQTHN